MLDIKFIRENPDVVKEEIRKRNMKIDLDSFLGLDKKKREIQQEAEDLRKKQNEANKLISQNKDEKIITEMKTIKNKLSGLDPELKNIEKQIKDILLQLPNITHKSVPVGKNEDDNVVIKKWGEKPEFDFQPKEHFEIESVKDLIDTERGAKVSGARFWYLKGDLARLEFALMQYAFEFYGKKGFELMIVPMLVREQAMFGTGFFPAEKNEIYNINADEDNLYLVGFERRSEKISRLFQLFQKGSGNLW